MKSLSEYLSEAIGTQKAKLNWKNLNKKTSLLDKKAIEKDVKEYSADYSLDWLVKAPAKLWDSLFKILTARIEPGMTYEEVYEIVKSYFSDDSELYEVGSYGYKNSKANWEGAGHVFFEIGGTYTNFLLAFKK